MINNKNNELVNDGMSVIAQANTNPAQMDNIDEKNKYVNKQMIEITHMIEPEENCNLQNIPENSKENNEVISILSEKGLVDDDQDPSDTQDDNELAVKFLNFPSFYNDVFGKRTGKDVVKELVTFSNKVLNICFLVQKNTNIVVNHLAELDYIKANNPNSKVRIEYIDELGELTTEKINALVLRNIRKSGKSFSYEFLGKEVMILLNGIGNQQGKKGLGKDGERFDKYQYIANELGVNSSMIRRVSKILEINPVLLNLIDLNNNKSDGKLTLNAACELCKDGEKRIKAEVKLDQQAQFFNMVKEAELSIKDILEEHLNAKVVTPEKENSTTQTCLKSSSIPLHKMDSKKLTVTQDIKSGEYPINIFYQSVFGDTPKAAALFPEFENLFNQFLEKIAA